MMKIRQGEKQSNGSGRGRGSELGGRGLTGQKGWSPLCGQCARLGLRRLGHIPNQLWYPH